MTVWNIGYNAAGEALDYTTIAASKADMPGTVQPGDTLSLWYSDTNKSKHWYESLDSLNALSLVSLQSGIAGEKIHIQQVYNTFFYAFDSDATNPETIITISDIIFSGPSITRDLFKIGSSGKNNEYPISFYRCEFYGCYYPISSYYSTGDGIPNVYNCYFFASNSRATNRANVYHCTAVNNTRGYYGGIARNCIAFNRISDYNSMSESSDSCISHDDTATGTNAVINAKYEDYGFWGFDSALRGISGGRVNIDSPVLSLGADCGVTDDIDGQTRTGGLGIGCSFGLDLTPTAQSTTPTDLAITDNGDGQSWLVTGTGQAEDASLYIYNHAGDALLAIVDSGGTTTDLTAGQSVYAKALESGKTLSDRYPAASGETVPALAASGAPTAPALTATNNEDGTAYFVISGSDEGTTNTVYTSPIASYSETLRATISGDGTSDDVDLDDGYYWSRATSTSNTGASSSNIAKFRVTSSTSAIIKDILDATKAVIDTASLEDADGTTITTEVEYFPIADNLNTGVVKIYAEMTTPEAMPTSTNQRTYRVYAHYVQRVNTEANRATLMKLKEDLENLFIGKTIYADLTATWLANVEESELWEAGENSQIMHMRIPLSVKARRAR